MLAPAKRQPVCHCHDAHQNQVQRHVKCHKPVAHNARQSRHLRRNKSPWLGLARHDDLGDALQQRRFSPHFEKSHQPQRNQHQRLFQQQLKKRAIETYPHQSL